MDEEKCKGCFYFYCEYPPSGKDGLYNGECRRNAPVAMIQKGTLGSISVKKIWPIVRSNDWCGEWQFSTTSKENE